MNLNGQAFNVVTVIDDDGKLKKFETKELFKINRDQLTSELMDFSANFGWWSRLAAEINHQKRQLKSIMDQTEAKVSLSIRKGGGDGVKLTEKTIESMIVTDPLVCKSVADYNEVCRLHEIVTSVVETLRTKQEMIKLYLNDSR